MSVCLRRRLKRTVNLIVLYLHRCPDFKIARTVPIILNDRFAVILAGRHSPNVVADHLFRAIKQRVQTVLDAALRHSVPAEQAALCHIDRRQLRAEVTVKLSACAKLVKRKSTTSWRSCRQVNFHRRDSQTLCPDLFRQRVISARNRSTRLIHMRAIHCPEQQSIMKKDGLVQRHVLKMAATRCWIIVVNHIAGIESPLK